MGRTVLTEAEVSSVLQRLAAAWRGQDYDLFSRNCSHFAEALCSELGVGPVPERITNLAGAGARLQGAAISAVAKASELDQAYLSGAGARLQGAARGSVISAAVKVGELDRTYRICAQVGEVVGPVGEVLRTYVEQVGELDAQYQVSATTTKTVSSVAAWSSDAFVVASTVAQDVAAALPDREAARKSVSEVAGSALTAVVAAEQVGRRWVAAALKADGGVFHHAASAVAAAAAASARSSAVVPAADRPRPPRSASEFL